MIDGLEWATSGDIFIAGKRSTICRAERNVAMAFQFYRFIKLSVEDNLALSLHAEKLGQAR